MIPSKDKDLLCATSTSPDILDGSIQKITLDGGRPVAMVSPNYPDLPYFVQPAPCYWRLIVTDEGRRIKLNLDDWEVLSRFI